MKNFSKIFIALGLTAVFGLSSCTDDLNVTPADPNVIQEPDLERTLAGCYQSLSSPGTGGADGSPVLQGYDGGMSTFQRSVFCLNELTTDEYVWLSFTDAGYYSLVTNDFSANNPIFYGTYSRLYIVVSICNNFLRDIAEGKFPGAEPAKIAEYSRQARIIRGLAYYYLVDMFGNVGYSDETLVAGVAPGQSSRAEIYNKVVAELEAISAEYGNNTDVVYGYVGKDACDALLAKFYLNAEVFKGEAEWEKCWNKCQEIIARHQGGGFNDSGLANHYLNLFGANNDQYVAGGSNVAENEIIWAIPQDAAYLTSYAGSTFMIAAGCANPAAADAWTMSPADYNSTEAWKCMVARKQFSEKFSWNGGKSADARVALWRTSDHGFIIDNPELSQATFNYGYANMKFTNFNYENDGQKSAEQPAATKFASSDYPIIRLADVYLMAAESAVRTGSHTDEALTYVNYIRERAQIPALTENPTLDNIIDERARELYGENCRRTDLVRFGKYAGGNYNWNWKGGVAKGQAIGQHMDLFPIPQTIIGLQNYKQNAGY